MVKNIIGGFITILMKVDIERRKSAIKSWGKKGFGYRGKLTDYEFRTIIKLGTNGKLW